MRLVHAGFRVQNLEEAIRLYGELGFTVSRRFEKPEPKARVAMLSSGEGPGIELWQFAEDHPYVEFIGRHVAFMCDDARKDAKRLVRSGFRIVIPFTEGVILDYIFVQNQFGLVYELAQKKA